jgi:Fur family transcriptional regulator, ferric uptake regulator
VTKARSAVLSALDSAAEPLSAAGVRAILRCPCDQATVYRALGFLEESGRAESFVLRCEEHGTERYFVSAARPHRHWFHCESCHRFIDLGECRLGELERGLEAELGLKVMRHSLYFSGLCPECGTKG